MRTTQEYVPETMAMTDITENARVFVIHNFKALKTMLDVEILADVH